MKRNEIKRVIPKKKMCTGQECIYCGSTDTITYSYGEGIMFEIDCNTCGMGGTF